jgi:ribonuclease Z
MKISFLGTASCFPTPVRGVSCTALQLENGQIWLFDCGEGSQIQIQKSNLRMAKTTKIFITHLHGDHLFGLPGLLCTVGSQMSEADRQTKVLDIYGPLGLRKYITTCLALARSPLPFKYNIHELVPDEDQFPPEWNDWQVDQESLDIANPMEKSARKVSSEIDPGLGER